MGRLYESIVVAGAAVVAACSQSSHSAPPQAEPPILASLDEVPAKVSIPAGSVVIGAAIDSAHRQANLAAFDIAKTPITVHQYKQCVDAKVCAPPARASGACGSSLGNAGATYSSASGTQDRPVTCVTGPQAVAYCAWVGGSLPTAEQWTLAARGPSPQRYAWGGTAPTCDKQAKIVPGVEDCCGVSCESDQAVAVNQHSAGDSVFQVSDILLTPGELVGAEAASSAPACRPPATACVASGVQPGAIDFFAPEPGDNPDLTRDIVSGFRCAWKGSSR